MPTTRFNFPLIAADQAQKHVPHNEAIDAIDALISGVVVSATTPAAPLAPVDGETFIIPAGAGGVFGILGAGSLATFRGGVWVALAPPFGFRVFVADEGAERIFAGSAGWVVGSVSSPSGAGLTLAVVERILDLAGAVTTAAALIPSRAIVLGVTSWTVAAITGAAAYRVGDAGDPARFGGGLGIAPGASNVGVIGPTATYAPGDVIVTAEGGAFTAGRVGLAALLLLPSGAPV